MSEVYIDIIPSTWKTNQIEGFGNDQNTVELCQFSPETFSTVRTDLYLMEIVSSLSKSNEKTI